MKWSESLINILPLVPSIRQFSKLSFTMTSPGLSYVVGDDLAFVPASFPRIVLSSLDTDWRPGDGTERLEIGKVFLETSVSQAKTAVLHMLYSLKSLPVDSGSS